MKHLKIFAGGGTRLLAILLASILVLATGFTANTFAIGDTISFTATSAKQSYGGANADIVHFGVSGDNSYVGACKDIRAEHSTSGSASATRIPNNYNVAKAAYYFGVVWGWGQYLGTTDGRGLTMQCIIQDLNGTIDDVIANPNQWTPKMVTFAQACKQRSQDALNNNNWQNVQVPDSFEVYTCNPSDGSQSFILWKGEMTGKVKLKKISSNAGITG